MKKIIQLACIGIILLAASCKDQSNEINPLFLLSNCVGDKTITVKATYNGSEPTSSVGTKRIYVYLFRSLGLSARDPQPAYQGSTTGEVSVGTEYTITIENVCDGDYYAMVAYDYRSGDAGIFDNRTDRYVLYGGAGHFGFTSLAAQFTVSGDMELNPVSFGDIYQLASGSVFMRPCTLTVNATYDGTDYSLAPEPGDGRLHVYLYDEKGTTTRNPAPLWAGSTTDPITPGSPATVTLSYVPAGSYYVVLFYDYNNDLSGKYDSPDDRYLIYNGTQYIVTAPALTLVDGGTQTWDAGTFGDSYTLQAGSAYMTPPPADLTVNVTYNGAAAGSGTGRIFVHLYDAGAWESQTPYGTRLPNEPAYIGSTVGAITPGDGATITFTDIAQWDYYIVVFYDYKDGDTDSPVNSNDDSSEDRYIIYSGTGNVGIPGSASAYSLTGDQTLNLAAFGDDYTFQTNILSNALFMQTGSLTVHATYTGSEPTTSVGTKRISVYLYESLGTGPHAVGSMPIYSASTPSAVTLDTEYALSITNILPGNYYVFVYYDYRSGTGTTPANQTDRYVLYNGVPYTSTASKFTVSTGSDLPGVSFGDEDSNGTDDFLLQSGTLFMVP